jgi:hypothetical protein
MGDKKQDDVPYETPVKETPQSPTPTKDGRIGRNKN